jgi:hypothetical protein
MTNPEDIEVGAIVIQTRAELVASRHHRHTRQGQQSCVPTILLMSPSNSPTGARRRHFATGTPSCSASLCSPTPSSAPSSPTTRRPGEGLAVSETQSAASGIGIARRLSPRRERWGTIMKHLQPSFSDFLRNNKPEEIGFHIPREIRSRSNLLKWVRERYPEMYRSYYLLSGGKNGRQIAEEMWTNYPRWKEPRR